ncbi:MAG: MATE family efflux transporter [Sphaerochaetaceae bacterium]|jgi:putative MATE family efflux protein
MSRSLTDPTRSIEKTIWMLAWPVILDQSFNTMVQYVDSAMVGSLGPIATAAVGSNSSTIWLVHGIMYAFGAAFSVFTARRIGAEDKEGVQHAVRQALLAILFFSVTVTTLMIFLTPRLPHLIGVEAQVVPDAQTYISYIAKAYPFTIIFAFMANLLRSSGDTRSPLISNIITNVTNIIGNFFLIFPTRTVNFFGRSLTIWGANMGVEGAAISTAVATALSALLLLGVLFFKDSVLKPQILNVSWKVDWSLMKRVFTLGVPLAMERATLNVGQIVLTILVTKIGTTALAAHHLAITAETITFLPASGFSMAATALVAQSLGAKKKDLAQQYAKKSLTYGILLMSATGALMFIFSTQLMSFFTRDPQVIALGSKVLRIEAFAEPFFAMSIVGSGILRGAGETRWPFINSLIGMWLIRLLPATILILYFDFGLMAAWSCMVADLVVRGLLNLYRYKKGDWLEAWKE